MKFCLVTLLVVVSLRVVLESVTSDIAGQVVDSFCCYRASSFHLSVLVSQFEIIFLHCSFMSSLGNDDTTLSQKETTMLNIYYLHVSLIPNSNDHSYLLTILQKFSFLHCSLLSCLGSDDTNILS